MDIVKVVCGIIFKNGLVLICRRKPEKSLGGFWEFPGGKVEKLESCEESLLRELVEELSLKVEIKQRFKSVIYHYDKASIELISFICHTENTVVESTDHDQIEWVKVEELLSRKLAPADMPIASELIDWYDETK